MSNAFICSAPRERFLDLVKETPELNLRITKMIGDRRRDIETRIKNLIFRDSENRVAFVLKDLFDNHADEESGMSSSIEFTHEQIADLAGLTRPTTTNILNEFQDSGLIELGRKKIILSDPQRLTSKAESD
jgi:CRP-like cAMP-binding protein